MNAPTLDRGARLPVPIAAGEMLAGGVQHGFRVRVRYSVAMLKA
jgi:hypothetical protein